MFFRLTFIAVAGCLSLSAQSVSTPQLISKGTDSCKPSPGNCYITVTMRAASIYQKANWYTAFISKNVQGTVVISINGTLLTGAYQDKKAADPAQLNKNGSDVTFLFQPILIDSLPMTFTKLTLDVAITKSAKDGVNDLLTLLAQTSKPAYTVSQSVLGVASTAKSVADFLFQKNLVDNRAVGSIDASPGSPLAPGTYAVLAGDAVPDYQTFLKGLTITDGGTLTSDAGPVQKVTWYAFDVHYKPAIYSDFSGALSFGKYKSWVALYQAAINAATATSWQLKDYATVKENIEKQEDDARVLLAADLDLTDNERTSLAQDANDTINTAFKKSYMSRLPDPTAPPVPLIDVDGIKVPSIPPTVLGIHNDLDQMLSTSKTLAMGLVSKE